MDQPTETFNLCPHCEMWVKGNLDEHVRLYCPIARADQLRRSDPLYPHHNILLGLVPTTRRR